jgi:hypothetical protein
VREERRVLSQRLGRLQVGVPRERADGDGAAVDPHVRQVLQAADVDEDGRRRQPQLHEREQRVAAGEELGVVAVAVQRADGVLEGLGALVVERSGDHDRASLFVRSEGPLGPRSSDGVVAEVIERSTSG